MVSLHKVSELRLDTVQEAGESVVFTLDLDWCHDEVLDFTLEYFRASKVPVTIFATHSSPYLVGLLDDPLIEIGIHPNFNDLLDGKIDSSEHSFRSRVDNLLEEFPEAKSVRAHSLTNAPRITSFYAQQGLTHESNLKLSLSASLDNRPFMSDSGVLQCPISWGDFSDYESEFVVGPVAPQFMLVNFHPIHVFLNTSELTLYERTRSIHHSPTELRREVNLGEGIRTRLVELIAYCAD